MKAILAIVSILIILALAWGNQVNATNYDGATRFVYYYIEVPVELEDWESLSELEQFLEEDDTDSLITLKAGTDGEIKLGDYCVTQAEQLRDRAAQVGKNLEVVPLSPREYRRIFLDRRTEYHAVCMARVGHSYYLIETDNDVVKRAYKIP